MEKNFYTNFGNRVNKTFKDKRDSELFSIRDFLDNKWVIQDKNELREILIKELKQLLNKENLFDLIESFFELETELHQAEEKLMIDEDLCDFDEFYKNLSPVLLRSLLEVSQSSSDTEVILGSIKESLRIAIEEQIYQIVE